MLQILISACLIGENCKWDGSNNRNQDVLNFMKKMEGKAKFHPVCPEQLGGLPTPRPPAECCGDRVLTEAGADVTAQYRRGAEAALQLARLYNCRAAILKANSPSCGSGTIYDGPFRHRRISGDGLTAALLKANGVQVYNEDTFAALL